jgi:hypothetical protein
MPLFILILLLVVPFSAQAAVETADPNATVGAQQLLAYLKGLPGQSTQRLISGQMIWRDGVLDAAALANGTTRPPLDYQVMADIHTNTVQYAGLIGMLEPGAVPDDPVARQFTLDHWNAGGLIMSHILIGNGPEYWFGLGNVNLDTITSDPRYIASLDALVTNYLFYQSQGVVFLARPFFEMNGKWAWFYTTNYQQYKNLWIQFYNYMTSHGVHNLLYVYAPSADFGDYLERYPGDAYVDVVGLDWYSEIGSSPLEKLNGYDELVLTGKPFALTEYGPFSNNDPITYQSRDYRLLLDGLKQNMPKTVWWMAWSSPWDLAAQQHISTVLNDPWVQNRPVPFTETPPPTVAP